MKPRIRLSGGGWICCDDLVEGRGKTPVQAWMNWSDFSERYAFREKSAKPLRATRKHRNDPVRHRGKSITVATEPKAASIERPAYPESIVRQVHGIITRPAYVPPLGMRLNMERAAGVQPPILSVSGTEGAH